MVSLDVLTMGRISVDVYPLQVGVSLREVESFGKYLGGSSTNVAVASARYGHRVATITRTGADPFGEFLHDALKGFGVDDRYVTAGPRPRDPGRVLRDLPARRLPALLLRPRARRRRTWRSATDELDYDAIRAARVFWVTVTGLSDEPSRSATLAALEARGKSGITVLDLDYRPMFWESRETAREWVGRALEHVTVAVGNLDETDTAVGEREPRAAAQALRERGVELAVVKQGPKGVLADDGETTVEVPPVPVEVVNGLGAGDAFGGALCHGLLSGWDLETEDAVLQRGGGAGRVAAGVCGRDAGGARGGGVAGPCLTTTCRSRRRRPAGPSAASACWRGEAAFDTGDDELIVLPLEGGAEVTVDGESFTLRGPRPHLGRPDRLRLRAA